MVLTIPSFCVNGINFLLQIEPKLPFSLSPSKRRFLVMARFVTTLGVALWLGGMAFFGAVAAPVIFPMSRKAGMLDLAPRMAAVMLGRFSKLTLVCAALMCLGWLAEGWVARPLNEARRLWIGQGTVTAACLALAIYLGGILLPQTEASQAAILPIIMRAERGEVLTPPETAQRAAFDREHQRYKSLASLNLCFLLVVLFLLSWRDLAESSGATGNSARKPSAETPPEPMLK